MSYESSEGVVEYITDGKGLQGRETFRITRHPDGSRMLRARCEMFDDDLLRDVFLCVDGDWRPKQAHIHLQVGDHYSGDGHYLFNNNDVLFQGCINGVSKRKTIGLVQSVSGFGSHAVQNDAWMYAAFDQQRGTESEFMLKNIPVSSTLPNGGDGPDFYLRQHHHRFHGEETIETRAGQFDTRHYQFLLADKPPIDYWVTGPDYILVKARWDLLQQTYELVSLERG